MLYPIKNFNSKKTIIFVAGLKGSGKNTFANQCAYHYLNNLFDPNGQKISTGVSLNNTDQSANLMIDGKTLCLNEINHNKDVQKNFGLRVRSLAEPLKHFCVNGLGLTEDQVCGTDEQKNSMTNIRMPSMFDKDEATENQKLNARQVMQFVGTDMFRAICPDVWVNHFLKFIKETECNFIIVPDVRFDNEVTIPMKILPYMNVNYAFVKLRRSLGKDSHKSEKGISENLEDRFDLVLHSTVTMEEQFLAAEGLVKDLMAKSGYWKSSK